ncbi:MAG TPA: hypothetical protein DCM07_23855 [Planctomycetaceae bacterium]|uniref:hypothetical protein n=2 Tax=Gimesia TaxID=1649453 RepID=UPI000C4CDDEE|nr:hypothetical protein [Gimesia sp.]MAX36555.1 hypothetical protein [Gimesia sp.]HAH47833.1 hypothetical protein [Planctomycetaceae bacterium]|tara:strand:- start:86264 stop:86884 length:621 start_codon:yes stop_codon:yes gene_type:complete
MSIIPCSFLFRHSIALPLIQNIPQQRGRLLNLPASALLPDLTFDKSKKWGKLKVAWNPEGLAISLQVNQKNHPVTAVERLKVWIDTRDTKTIHRASRYCHAFEFQPVGPSGKPVCQQQAIHRAQDDAPQCDLKTIGLWAKTSKTGYDLDIWLPASELYGFDPASYPQTGFYYQVSDSELGEQFMMVDHEFPFAQDPSLWATLRFEQ